METSDSIDNVDHMVAYVAQASVTSGQLLILMFIAAIMGLGKGGVPGFATIATALTVTTAPLTVVGGLGYAVSLQVPILTMIDVSAAWLHCDSLDWPTVWLLLPLSFVGMLVGQFLTRYMSDSASRIMVGFILLSILTLKIKDDVASFLGLAVRPKRKVSGDGTGGGDGSDEDDIESSAFVGVGHRSKETPLKPLLPSQPSNVTSLEKIKWASIVGIFGGAATMLTNSMGPILNVYLLSVRKLSPTSYIGTRAMFFCFLNLGKLPMRFYSGTLGWSMIPLAAGLGLVSVLGVFCAKPIMLSMTERTFVRLELLVIALAGIRLMYMGLMR